MLCWAALLSAAAAPAASAEPGVITGVVTMADGSAFDLGGTVTAYDDWSAGVYQTPIRADGSYSLGPLPAGSYRVHFEPAPPYQDEWWDDWHGDSWSAARIYLWEGNSASDINARVSRASSVSGKVTDDQGRPVAGVSVFAYRDQDGWSALSDASTDAQGEYRLDGIPQGEVNVQFRGTGSVLGEWWDDQEWRGTATDIPVTADADVTGIDAVLAAPSRVSGAVTDKAGRPIAGISVSAWQENPGGWDYVSDASTDETGRYLIGGLRPGLARVHFSGNDTVVGEWWQDKASFVTANEVVLPASAEVAGIDAVLAAASSVSGAVSAEGGAPAAGISVQAWQQQGSGWEHVRDVSTDATGAYRIGGLHSGAVRVHFVGRGDLIGEWWDNAATLGAATDIPVGEEADVTGIDAVLKAYASLSGRVTDAAGDPVPAGVYLYRWNGAWFQYAGSRYADWNGEYSFRGLAPGRYAVYYWHWDFLEEWFDDASSQYDATLLQLESGQRMTGIDAALGSGSTMSGTVRSAEGTPLSGVTVRAYRYEPHYDDWDTYSVRTAADGSYSFSMLRDGTYLVEFSRRGDYFGEWYDGARTRERAADVTVPKDGVVEGIDAVLETGGGISGTVTARNRTLLAGIQVSAYQQDGHGVWTTTGRARTDSSGAFAVTGLAEGACKVRFSDPANQYLDGYWRGQQTFDEADTVAVTWGATTSGVNGVLIRGSHITGTVRRSDRTGVSGAQVAAYADDGDGGWTYLARITTDAGGAYDLPGLAAGAYRVRFSDPSKVLAPQWWQGAADVSAARSVRLDRQDVRAGVDAVLRPAGAISGTVSESGGAALRNVAVVAYGRDADGGWSYVDKVSTDALGHYAIQGFGTGKYRLRAVDKWPYWWSGADRGAFLDQWYDGAYALSAATDIPVTAGAETGGIDIGLERAGHIAGAVTDASGEGIGRASVEVQRYDGHHWRYFNYDMTRADGAYDVGQLPSGTYRVYFRPPWRSRYAAEYYDGAYTGADATLVAVAAGRTTSGIDAVLEASSRLRGSVSGPDGEPLSGISVYVARYTDDGEWQYTEDSSTDATGAWKLDDIAPGTVRIRFNDGSGALAGEFWDDQITPQDATTIAVTAGQLVDQLDAQLSPAGSITGRATGPDGRRVEGTQVHLWALGPSGWHNAIPGDYGFTNHFGQFRFDGLHEGRYRISVDGRRQGFAPLFWPASPDLAGASDIVVAAGQKVTGIDLQLGAGESIAGHVTDGGGRGAAVSVTAFRADGADWEAVADASADATGAYTLRDLAPGTYRLRFGDDDGWSISWFFDRWASNAASLEDADDIAVRAGDGTVVVDASLLHKAQPVSLTSATHPDQTAWYRTRDLAVGWQPADASVADGYGWLLDRRQDTVVPKSVSGGQTSASYSGLGDGTWYFHVRGLGVQEALRGVLKSSWSPTVAYVVHIDTAPPTTVAPVSQTVARGSYTTLQYRVNDAAPNGGTAAARIEIRDARGRLATTLDLGTQPVNRLLGARFRCTLAAGTYTFSVFATDAAGNPQSRTGSNKLKVR
jgi:5-hydroxyisourate hydrolase-like protein (transthyretin family)